MLRILIVAMSTSIHTSRWVSHIKNLGWDVHLFPSIDHGAAHKDIEDVTIHHSFYASGKNPDRVKIRGIPLYNENVAHTARKTLEKLVPEFQVARLNRVISRFRPTIIHSMEIQHAGYLTLEAKKLYSGEFPTWIVTNWGSDIYLYGRLAEHRPKIVEVLRHADYYSSECQRDVCLAKSLGFSGVFLPVFPNGGGFDLERCRQFLSPGPTSVRRTIMLKGYQHFAGRALTGLRAIERCAELLKDYQIVIHSPSDEVIIAAELFTNTTGIKTVILPPKSPHEQILKYHGLARISLGISISDAISTSLLEAMVMGSFPIQSWTACADEWIENGITGILVSPDDPDEIELAIRHALSDDLLVDNASEKNREVALQRLDHADIKNKIIEFYKSVAFKSIKPKE